MNCELEQHSSILMELALEVDGVSRHKENYSPVAGFLPENLICQGATQAEM